MAQAACSTAHRGACAQQALNRNASSHDDKSVQISVAREQTVFTPVCAALLATALRPGATPASCAATDTTSTRPEPPDASATKLHMARKRPGWMRHVALSCSPIRSSCKPCRHTQQPAALQGQVLQAAQGASEHRAGRQLQAAWALRVCSGVRIGVQNETRERSAQRACQITAAARASQCCRPLRPTQQTGSINGNCWQDHTSSKRSSSPLSSCTRSGRQAMGSATTTRIIAR